MGSVKLSWGERGRLFHASPTRSGWSALPSQVEAIIQGGRSLDDPRVHFIVHSVGLSVRAALHTVLSPGLTLDLARALYQRRRTGGRYYVVQAAYSRRICQRVGRAKLEAILSAGYDEVTRHLQAEERRKAWDL